MGKTATLAKPAGPALDEPPDQAALRRMIARIIQQEYSGDNCSEFWARPARAAAERIVEALYESRGSVSG